MSLNDINNLTEKIIGCAIEVHKHLGPGLLESIYQECLKYELSVEKIHFRSEVPIPIKYKELSLDCAYRIDLIIENLVIVELKAVEFILPVHQAQLLTYLKTTGKRVGLLINFNTELLKNGITRMIL